MDRENQGTADYVETREIPLDELTPYPGNAKRGDIETIRASLRRNGQYRSLIVREVPHGPLIVLAGNHTMQALKAEGSAVARCEVIRCDDAAARRINLADNRTAELGGYDNAALLAILDAMDGDFDGTGYTDAVVASVLADVVQLPQGEPTAPEDPEPPAEFPEFGEDIETEHQCPKCGYEWSGKTK